MTHPWGLHHLEVLLVVALLVVALLVVACLVAALPVVAIPDHPASRTKTHLPPISHH